MVAYSFQRCFASQIAFGLKCQTVRADRLRHARPGEAIQLYTGMRTRHCRRIRPDVVCQDISRIQIDVASFGIRYIKTDVWITGYDLEEFARADGFDPAQIDGATEQMESSSALQNMSRFWLENYGEGLFEGVLIRWRLS